MTKRTAEQSIRDDLAYTRRILAVLEVRRQRAQERVTKAQEDYLEAERRVANEHSAIAHLEEALIALVGEDAVEEPET